VYKQLVLEMYSCYCFYSFFSVNTTKTKPKIASATTDQLQLLNSSYIRSFAVTLTKETDTCTIAKLLRIGVFINKPSKSKAIL